MVKKRRYWSRNGYGFRKTQEMIKEYGYEYSLKKHITLMAAAIGFLMLLCYLMRIEAVGVCVIVLTVFFAVPILAGYHYKILYEEKRFTDAVDYMEYAIYSFLRMPKIINALEEVAKVCHGSMKKCVEKAVDRIQYADVYQDIYTDAFEYIEKEYGTQRMKALHRFMTQIEQQGGEYIESLEVLLEDIRQWAEMVYLLQKERKELQKKVTLSILLSVATAIIMVGLLPSEIGDIASNRLYQVSSVAFLWLSIMVFVLSRKCLIRSWLTLQPDSEDVNHAYDYCIREENTKKRHYRFMEKKVKNSIRKDFPMWIRNVILNMQTENVMVAMGMAAQDMSYPLRTELVQTLDRIEKEPGSMQAYQSFLWKFDLKQIKNVFLMFYSLNEFGTKEAEKQLNAMIHRNNKLAKQAERLANEEALGVFGIYMLMPMVIAAGKMLLDMWVFVQQFLLFYSNVV